jgi:hypothetical protein
MSLPAISLIFFSSVFRPLASSTWCTTHHRPWHGGLLPPESTRTALRYIPVTRTTAACDHLGYRLARPERARYGVLRHPPSSSASACSRTTAYVAAYCHPDPANDGNTPVSVQPRAHDVGKTVMLMYLAQHLSDNEDQVSINDLEEQSSSHSDSD